MGVVSDVILDTDESKKVSIHEIPEQMYETDTNVDEISVTTVVLDGPLTDIIPDSIETMVELRDDICSIPEPYPTSKEVTDSDESSIKDDAISYLRTDEIAVDDTLAESSCVDFSQDDI